MRSQSDIPDEASGNPETLFLKALQLVGEDRNKFLSIECGGDAELQSEVEALLVAHESAGEFMPEHEWRTGMGSPGLVTPATPLAQSEDAGDRIGPFKLLQRIGEGGFGVVWMAEQEKPVRRRVALKIVKLGMDTKEVVARFEQERQALAMMEHSNIARVYDAGATPFGRPYFVMELVNGVRITDYCDEVQLSTSERLKLFMQVCNAVQHAHQKGIIHRDLKPSNILVTMHDGVPIPKVIDFGIAKATQQQRLTDLTVITHLEQMIGTPLYMAPEQAERSGLDIDTRSDIYSLGVLLYELLTGRTPFDPKHLLKVGFDEIRRVIREEEPLTPSTFVSTMAVDIRSGVAMRRGADGPKLISSIRGDLDWIVMKALEKDRNRRYGTASSFAQDIQRHLASQPIEARPASAGYRFRRFVKRNRMAFIGGASIAITLLLGSAVSLWQAMRAGAALDELRSSAPAFAEQARSLAAQERFDEAVDKLDYAIKLRPDVASYLISKADLLQSQFQFAEARILYREAHRINPRDARAHANEALCEKLLSELRTQASLSRSSLVELFGMMAREQRSAAEMMKVGRLLGEQNKVLLNFWAERLKDLPIPQTTPLRERLTLTPQGELALDLSNTEMADLAPLSGMPLTSLDLFRCDKVVDLSPLRGMPLRSLGLDGTEVVDLSPLAGMMTLRTLHLQGTKVRDLFPLQGLPLDLLLLNKTLVDDLSPLRGMPLQSLEVDQTLIRDISPLAGMPLRKLTMARTNVVSLAALAGMPLEELDLRGTLAKDFSPIAGAKLESLLLDWTAITDLSLLKSMPLKTLSLRRCRDVRGFATLRNIETLEVLRLPVELHESELASVRLLRSHPRLHLLTISNGDDLLPPEAFWKHFDDLVRDHEVNAELQKLARAGEYRKAADLRQMTRHQSLGPISAAFTLGNLLLADGDIIGYQAVCSEMVQRFRRRVEGDEVTVRLCLMNPNPGVPVSELRRLMPHLPLVSETTVYRCWFVLTNGMLEYRSGRYAEAIELLRQVETGEFPAALIAAEAGLSMAYHQQGEVERANLHLSHAQAQLNPCWPAGTADNRAWRDLLFAYLLVREAERTLSQPVISPTGK